MTTPKNKTLEYVHHETMKIEYRKGKRYSTCSQRLIYIDDNYMGEITKLSGKWIADFNGFTVMNQHGFYGSEHNTLRDIKESVTRYAHKFNQATGE